MSKACETREIGDPVRRGVYETLPFSYRPSYVGAYADYSVRVYDDRTDEDVTALVFPSGTTTFAAGVITSPQPQFTKAEVVYRVHFRFMVNGQRYDEFRRVIIE